MEIMAIASVGGVRLPKRLTSPKILRQQHRQRATAMRNIAVMRA